MKRVQEYIYLEQKIGGYLDHEQKIKRRIRMEWNAFGRRRQHNVIVSNFSLSLKKKVYNQCILLVLTYESDTWSLKKARERKLIYPYLVCCLLPQFQCNFSFVAMNVHKPTRMVRYGQCICQTSQTSVYIAHIKQRQHEASIC